MTRILALSFVVAAGCGSDDDGGDGGGCPAGSLGCACTAGGTCEAGLECVSDRCVEGDGSDSDVDTDSDTETDSGSETESATETESETDTGSDTDTGSGIVWEGCADGTREGAQNSVTYPDIAGCSGGWDVPGIYEYAAPACDRAGGDDGDLPEGTGCNVEDLCEEGWHVCTSSADVAAHVPDASCAGIPAEGATVGLFFATRQSGPGCGECATGVTAGCTASSCGDDCAPNADTANDLFGCSGPGVGAVALASCAPIATWAGDACASVGASWLCGDVDATDEARVVTKDGSGDGGVLCCRD